MYVMCYCSYPYDVHEIVEKNVIIVANTYVLETNVPRIFWYYYLMFVIF